jgi:hypothetical protein
LSIARLEFLKKYDLWKILKRVMKRRKEKITLIALIA